MIRRLLRFALKLGVVGSVVAVAVKVLDRRRSAPSDWSASTEPWPPIQPSPEERAVPVPSEPDPASLAQNAEGEAMPAEAMPPAGMWVEPGDSGECPVSHPVKAKLSSGVFHLPGMANYERTNPDRCYADAGAAEADGLRQAKH